MDPFRILADRLGRVGPSFDAATLRDAARIAVQSGAASVAAYLALRAIGSEEMFVGILSAVMILQPSVGGTMDAARTRLSASALGSVIGLACLFALPAGWGTAAGLLVTMFVLNGLAVAKPAWSYGVVAAVALSISTSDDLVAATLDRLLAIGVGAAVGLLVSAALWRDTAGARFERHLTSAMRQLSEAFRDVVGKAGRDDPEDAVEGRDAVRGTLSDAQEACGAMHLADMGSRRARLEAVRALFESIGLLDAVAERTEDLRDAGLGDALDAFRAAGSRVIEGLRDDDLPVGAMADLDAAFARLGEALRGRELPDPRGCDRAHVIAFAAGSIRDRLSDLAAAAREGPEETVGWAARVTTRRARS